MSSDAPPQLPEGSPELKPPFFARPAGKIFVIWVVLTAIGVLMGVYLPHHMLPSMLSTDGHTLWVTIVLFTVLAAPVAGFVYAVGLYSLLAWRHKGTDPDEPPPDGPAMRGNGTATLLWLVTSSVLVVVLLVWGLAEYSAEAVSHPNTLQVDVTGQQWLWTFSYPGTGASSRTLELPVNRPVQFHVTSEDVTHGFWMASLGIQVDANPGEDTVIQTTPTHLGSFYVRCSQLCGLYHSFMYAPGEIVTPQKFAQWLRTQGSSAGAAARAALASTS